MLGALRDERIDHARRLRVGDVGAAPVVADGLAQDDGGLGEVRREDVGAGGKFGHRVAQLGRVGGVDLAVIGHDGVDHAQCVGVGLVQIANAINLLGRAQKAGVHGVDLDPDALPRVRVVLHDARRVVHVPAGEGGVAGEQPCRHGAHVATCGGKHGNRHAERAFPVPAQVVDGSDARDVVVAALVEMQVVRACHDASLPFPRPRRHRRRSTNRPRPSGGPRNVCACGAP